MGCLCRVAALSLMGKVQSLDIWRERKLNVGTQPVQFQ